MANNKNTLRYFYRVSAQGHPVPGSLIARNKRPGASSSHEGKWKEISPSLCCTTTTTTTSSTTTTTTT